MNISSSHLTTREWHLLRLVRVMRRFRHRNDRFSTNDKSHKNRKRFQREIIQTAINSIRWENENWKSFNLKQLFIAKRPVGKPLAFCAFQKLSVFGLTFSESCVIFNSWTNSKKQPVLLWVSEGLGVLAVIHGARNNFAVLLVKNSKGKSNIWNRSKIKTKYLWFITWH